VDFFPFESKEMSHGRHAVRYQCPSRDDESNDYGESEGQCGPYQEPQGFGKVPERSGTFCFRPDPNGQDHIVPHFHHNRYSHHLLKDTDILRHAYRETFPYFPYDKNAI
jgi:hypothetical protein